MKIIILLLFCLMAMPLQATNGGNNGDGCHGNCPQEGGASDVVVNNNSDLDLSNVVENSSFSTSEAEGGQAIIGDTTGGSSEINSNYSDQVPAQSLYLNSNMESCIRVLGFAFATDKASTLLGVPLRRDKSCDMWKAVSVARSFGHDLLAYSFMCEIRNIKNIWGIEQCKIITKTTEKWWADSLGVDSKPGNSIKPVMGLMLASAPPTEQDYNELKEEVIQLREELKQNIEYREEVQQKTQEVELRLDASQQAKARALEILLKQMEKEDG